MFMNIYNQYVLLYQRKTILYFIEFTEQLNVFGENLPKLWYVCNRPGILTVATLLNHDSGGTHDERVHDDVIKWKHFPRHWPFVRGIHRSPVN